MKKLLLSLITGVLFTTYSANAQDKNKPRPSLPDTVKTTISSGATVEIDYSRPSVKGRTIGKDLEPMEGKVWRTGANEATSFVVDKAVKVDGKTLPAGKYAFFTIKNGNVWTLIFNKTWKTWGAFDYEKNKAEDALKVDVKGAKAPSFAEKVTYTVAKDGKVSMLWGDYMVNFTVK
ncbi:DUF2911 domain-containing protein [uncultured Mucilaginibacter sp.]|uniref:DUF2911 domain-containing protein n=1 Tax=uncultured Mucilaginibacter sp. TaxID=797541 RepID=UPI00260F7A29|nr:DUF2911 domain-containing protein [uncultured Mucilaginibacter sp.]